MTALRDDVVLGLHAAVCKGGPRCPVDFDEDVPHPAVKTWRGYADTMIAVLRRNYDLDEHLAARARYRAGGEELADTVAAVQAQRAGEVEG